MNKNDLKIKIFADGADKKSLLDLAKKDWISGCTTNPTLLRKAGVTDYKAFALDVLSEIKDKPISFEVFADDFNEMKRQALEIASWGENVYVKIPISNTKGEGSYDLINDLSHNNIKLNITAVFTVGQAMTAANALLGGCPSIISIFAGRIHDSGVDASALVKRAVSKCSHIDSNIEILWASPRQLYDIVEAQYAGCNIITVSNDILSKIDLLGKNLEDFSLDTVKMFANDAAAAGYIL